MKTVEIWNYYDRYETIRLDQIETVVKAGPSPHDHGAVVLLGGRRITFGNDGQAERVIKAMNEATE